MVVGDDSGIYGKQLDFWALIPAVGLRAQEFHWTINGKTLLEMASEDNIYENGFSSLIIECKLPLYP